LAFTLHGIANNESEKSRQAYLVYAIKLISAADAVRKSIGLPVNFLDQAEYDRELEEIRHSAGNHIFQSAWQTGQTMDFDQVIIMTREDPHYPGFLRLK